MPAHETPAHDPRLRFALLADDDRFMLNVPGDMLRDLGITGISTAANGIDAAAALDRMVQPSDLVLCDLNMPQTDGLQFMEQLGKRSFGGVVVLVSGMDARTSNSASLMARFHGLKILGTWAKPVDAAALRAVLDKLA